MNMRTDHRNGEPNSREHKQYWHHRLMFITHYKWWIRVLTYIFFLLAGQTAATLLGRLYFDKGGNSKWLATLVQTAGFPIIIPLLIYFSKARNPSDASIGSPSSPSRIKTALLYSLFGLGMAGDNMMYSYGLLYLPVSTYSLLSATQLAFNALFSYFLNSQKFTALILNSLVLLTMSASLLAMNADLDGNTKISRGKYIIGFLLTIVASAGYSLALSLMEFSFERVFRSQTYVKVLRMQVNTAFVATCVCVVGLFASGDWKRLNGEMEEYTQGKVSYVTNLAGTAISWQICSVGMLGLVNEVSSLFSNVISTLGLPLVPVFAVVFFHDKMNGVKVMALLLALWGFLSYIYQHYLDDAKAKETKAGVGEVVHGAALEIC